LPCECLPKGPLDKPNGFPKRLRLATKADIAAVYRRGRYHRLGRLHAKSLPSERREARFLISVKKSIGTAPERNRIKRLVREAIRRGRQALEQPHDVCVFLTRRPEPPLTLGGVEQEIQALFQRLRSGA